MKTDKYGEIINAPETYKAIATVLGITGSCLIGWTDEEATHFDILFNYQIGGIPTFAGQMQGGIQATDLFISIMRIGCFGFEVKNEDTYWTYYNEKLGYHLGETTGKKIAELINGVKKELR